MVSEGLPTTYCCNLKKFSVTDIYMSANGIGFARVGCDFQYTCKIEMYRDQTLLFIKRKMRACKFADQQAKK